MNQSSLISSSTIESTNSSSGTLKDTVDSIRLKKNASRNSLASIDWNVETSDSAIDFDIESLDKQFQQLSLDFKHSMQDLRNDPHNETIRKKVKATMEDLSRIKTWSSLLKTEEGFAIVKEAMLQRRRNEVNQRKYEIDEVLKLTKAQSTVDVCFLMDCTGSMGCYIDATKTQIGQLTDTISKLYDTTPRLAFIGYRDIDESIEQLDFTDDVDAFKMFLNQVKATGGHDTCEDVFSGLEIIPTLTWSNSNRLLIHICDAPCHGRDYYKSQDSISDTYPKGDPKNRELSKLLLDIKRLKVTYCTIQLNDFTKQMFDEFSFIYGTISEIHVENPAAMIKRVCQETSDIIMSSIKSTMSSFRSANKQTKPYTLLGKEPDWSTVDIFEVHTIEVIPPLKMEDLFRSLFIGRGSGKIKIAPHPFAQGSLRFAFYGQLASDGYEMMDVVFKEFSSSSSYDNQLEVYQEHLEIQAIAKFLAEQFNDELKRIIKKPITVVYADADLVQVKSDESKVYQVEARMHQDWHKWNNNSGGVSVTEYSTVLQAFSHWTHHITAARLMVVDLQGVKVDNAYLLTDPAIHCDDLLRFKHTRTNFGVKGMREFFRTHICSEVCSLLQLPLHETELSSSLNNSNNGLESFIVLNSIDELDEKTAIVETYPATTKDYFVTKTFEYVE
ncbi:unnamed protein product [Adineta ricciae]|uniref:Alpha-type protein kinase domain-containing protein n=1 Tax=Adineta ricciae TaxID=249248 RepID=A0A815GGG3_ADIRI|nr:unnamed protein product [Adineta ricciae]CAF1515763.1 unnamed protein product [Adineta ricciae]